VRQSLPCSVRTELGPQLLRTKPKSAVIDSRGIWRWRDKVLVRRLCNRACLWHIARHSCRFRRRCRCSGHGDLVNANSVLYEYWQLTRKADVDRALGQPAGQAAALQSKDANAFRRFATGAGWSPEDHAQLVENMKRIKREFPAVVSNKGNSDAIAGWLLDQKRCPTYPNMRFAVTTLACDGKLLLNPSAVGIPEDKYGDSIEGGYQISRVSAADLKLMTEPFRPQSELDEIRAMSADEYYRSEHGRPLREERNRKADQYIFEQEVRQADAAVDFFLAANREYAVAILDEQ